MCSRKLTSEATVALQVPLATHGGGAAFMPLDIEQAPVLATGGLGTRAGIVLFQPAGRIKGPADVGSRPARRHCAEDVDIAAGFVRSGQDE